MIIKNFLEQVLNESLQKVYHATPLNALYSILKNDTLELVPNIANVEKALGGKEKYYYLSTMRNKSGKYFLGSDKVAKTARVDTYLELDYDYLKSRMKSLPVDYWGSGRKYSEEEERFWSNDSELKNISKFVKSIHVLVRKETDEFKGSDIKKLQQLKFMAKTRNVPIFFYDSPENYVVGKKSIELEDDENFDGYVSLGNKSTLNEINSIIKLINDEKLDGKDAKFLKDLFWYSGGYQLSDQSQVIEDFLHRSMKTDDEDVRNAGRDFINFMKKYKKHKVIDFLKYVVLDKIKNKFGMEK